MIEILEGGFSMWPDSISDPIVSPGQALLYQ